MAREIVNLIAEGYDYIETLTHIADDKALVKDINFYRVAELMPVLRLHKVRGRSKMHKAEIVETIIKLVHARKTGEPVTINTPAPKAKENKAEAKRKAKIEAVDKKLRCAKDMGEVRKIYNTLTAKQIEEVFCGVKQGVDEFGRPEKKSSVVFRSMKNYLKAVLNLAKTIVSEDDANIFTDSAIENKITGAIDEYNKQFTFKGFTNVALFNRAAAETAYAIKRIALDCLKIHIINTKDPLVCVRILRDKTKLDK